MDLVPSAAEEPRPPSRANNGVPAHTIDAPTPPAVRPPSRSSAPIRRMTDSLAQDRMGARPPSSSRRIESYDKKEDTLGPKLHKATADFAALATQHASMWADFHSLLHAAQSERSELMRTVAQQEHVVDSLQEELNLARDEHHEHVLELKARAQVELEQALEAARLDWEQRKLVEWKKLRQEFEREKAQVSPARLACHKVARSTIVS